MGRLFFDIKKCAGGAYEERSIAAIYYDKEVLWPTPLVLSDDIIDCDDIGGTWTIFISGLDSPIPDNYTIEGVPEWITIEKQNGKFTVLIDEYSNTDETREAQIIVRSVENTDIFDTLQVIQQGDYVTIYRMNISEDDIPNGISMPTFDTNDRKPTKINWGDGAISYNPNGGFNMHIYTEPGIYDIRVYRQVEIPIINGTFSRHAIYSGPVENPSSYYIRSRYQLQYVFISDFTKRIGNTTNYVNNTGAFAYHTSLNLIEGLEKIEVLSTAVFFNSKISGNVNLKFTNITHIGNLAFGGDSMNNCPIWEQLDFSECNITKFSENNQTSFKNSQIRHFILPNSMTEIEANLFEFSIGPNTVANNSNANMNPVNLRTGDNRVDFYISGLEHVCKINPGAFYGRSIRGSDPARPGVLELKNISVDFETAAAGNLAYTFSGRFLYGWAYNRISTIDFRGSTFKNFNGNIAHFLFSDISMENYTGTPLTIYIHEGFEKSDGAIFSEYGGNNNMIANTYADIYMYPNIPPNVPLRFIDAGCFTSNTKIHVPAGSLSAYQQATNWVNKAAYMVGDL